jgi:hypothetical protein
LIFFGMSSSFLTQKGTAWNPRRFTVTLPDESTRDYFVDPYRLEVLGSLDRTAPCPVQRCCCTGS